MDYNFLQKLNIKIQEKFKMLSPIQLLTWDGEPNRFDSEKEGDKAIWV